MSKYSESRALSYRIEGLLRSGDVISAFELLRRLQALIIEWDNDADARELSELSKVQD